MRVAIIGNFDGVHLGHRSLVGRAREIADAAGGRVVAVTFDPHPTEVLRPDRAPVALTTLDRRVELLREAGADEVVVLPFTPELAALSPQEFARLLRESPDIAADAVVVGANFRFGARAAGTTQTLADCGRDLGFTVEALPLVTDGVTWSSSYARECITSGDLGGAERALGRPHRLEGPVVRGDQRGRELGYPTANVQVDPRIAMPPDGVYAGWLVMPAGRLPAAVSIGTNPQFDGTERRVEAYALDRDDLDLYGARVGIDLVERLRGQEVFASVADLVAQMERDVAATRVALGG